MIIRDKDQQQLLVIAKRTLPTTIAIWAYGSRVNGDAHDTSDLDLVLRSQDLSPIDISAFCDFIEALQDSTIPILIQAFDWARIPKSFHQNILESYEVLRGGGVSRKTGNLKAGNHKGLPLRQRKSIRLKNYDYSQAGLYFITICTQHRHHLFGEIVNDAMVLNDAGTMIEKLWHEIPNNFKNTQLHEYIIMPNHIHGIIEIVVRASLVGAQKKGKTIGNIVGAFKSLTTNEYIKKVKQNILPPFDKRIWQRNYWEHIIRDENEYTHIAQYMMDNPQKWAMDPLNVGSEPL